MKELNGIRKLRVILVGTAHRTKVVPDKTKYSRKNKGRSDDRPFAIEIL